MSVAMREEGPATTDSHHWNLCSSVLEYRTPSLASRKTSPDLPCKAAHDKEEIHTSTAIVL